MTVETTEIGSYLQALESAASVPGGGSAGTLTASFGAALGHMAAIITAGKKKYRDREAELAPFLEKEKRWETELLALSEADMEVFAPVMKAYKLPGNTEEEKQLRDAEVEKALICASEIPMKVLKLCVEALETLLLQTDLCSPLVISDIAAGSAHLRCGLDTAAMNILVNAGLLKEKEKAEEMIGEASALREKGNDLADRIYEKVWSLLKGQK